VLLTRPPLTIIYETPLHGGILKNKGSFDLHVLGIPPALILSQDQTLQKRPRLEKAGATTDRNQGQFETYSCLYVFVSKEILVTLHDSIFKQRLADQFEGQ
jgi:hypothetical protein